MSRAGADEPNEPPALRSVARRYVRDLRPRGLPPLTRWDFPCHVATDASLYGRPATARVLRRFTLIARYEHEARATLEAALPPRSGIYTPINQGPVRQDGLYSVPIAQGVEGVEEITDPARVKELRQMHARLRRLSRDEWVGPK